MKLRDNTSLNGFYTDDLILHSNCQLRFYGIVEGNIEINEHCEVYAYGVIVGNVSVNDKAKFYLYGKLVGDLRVDEDATAELLGEMEGSIHENNGRIELYGSLTTEDQLPKNLIMHMDCSINGQSFQG